MEYKWQKAIVIDDTGGPPPRGAVVWVEIGRPHHYKGPDNWLWYRLHPSHNLMVAAYTGKGEGDVARIKSTIVELLPEFK